MLDPAATHAVPLLCSLTKVRPSAHGMLQGNAGKQPHQGRETLASNLIKAGTGPVFEPDVDVPKILYETLQRDGPCPSIAVGDHLHWRVICIDARNKTIYFIYPFGGNEFIAHCPEVVQAVLDFYVKHNADET